MRAKLALRCCREYRMAVVLDGEDGDEDTTATDRNEKCRCPGFALPAPFGPRNPVTLPGATSKLTSSTAVTGPKRLPR
jgi:hypothetical protein